MPAGKCGKRQPAEQSLEKGTKALKKCKKQTSTAAASSASSAKPLTKGSNKFLPLTKGVDPMETFEEPSEEEVFVEETSMDAPGNTWAEALQKGRPFLCKKVAIDWKGTLANDANVVFDSAIEAIEKLLGAEVQVYIRATTSQNGRRR